ARSATSVGSTSSASTSAPAATRRPPPRPPTDARGAYRPPIGGRLRAGLRRAAGAHLEPPGTVRRGGAAGRERAAGRGGGRQAPVPDLRACGGRRPRLAGGAARARAPGPVRFLDLRGRPRLRRRPCDRCAAAADGGAGGGARRRRGRRAIGTA